jgi:hypothetical protein
MAAEDGTAGPMHHSHGHMHEQAAPANATPSEECALRGTCSGPAAALLALLSTDGVLTDSIVSQNDFPSAGKAFPSTEQLIRQFASPDAPPPRA